MAIPKEFNYADEADCIQKLIVPLLLRMGFAMVENYHGKREFGKDLIFGEIDRWGTVQYHALQAKYVDSISLNGVQDVIRDAQQAFANPFSHPKTGAQSRINTFVVVNGGTFSDEASHHFFNSLAHPHGGHVRLIDGKALMLLDRWATGAQNAETRADLAGLKLELAYNRRIYLQRIKRYINALSGHPSGFESPVERFRSNAINRYIERPTLALMISNEVVTELARHVASSNTAIEELLRIGAANRALQIQGLFNREYAMQLHFANQLETQIDKVLEQLGPLIPL